MPLAWPEDVEVAQAHGLEAIALAPGAHEVLAGELGGGVRRKRIRAHRFDLREHGRVAIRAARRRVDDTSDTVATGGLEYPQGATDVHLVIERGDLDASRNAAQGGLVEHDLGAREGTVEDGVVANGAAEHFGSRSGAGEVGLASVGEVVDDPHRGSAFDERVGEMAADESGAAGHAHCVPLEARNETI